MNVPIAEKFFRLNHEGVVMWMTVGLCVLINMAPIVAPFWNMYTRAPKAE